MRKDRYVKQFAEHLPMLRRLAMVKGLDYDEANEVIGVCVEKLFANKLYASIEPQKLKAFLRAKVKFEVIERQRNLGREALQAARLPEPTGYSTDGETLLVISSYELPPVEERECPFCFKTNLNEYGACHMCHTIIPRYFRLQRTGYTITEESLAVEFDFNKPIDVHNAIAKLTPFEQKVVKACGLGNESLENFALDNSIKKSSLIRIWVKAKGKLQESLSDYAPGRLSKRGPSAFRKALEALVKQEKL